ncbi:hypothetical protein B0H12DRAFT_1237802 [Mycena haematopus]|nr:hypothetical protein B0H12DRAFT_1237802 [Mycena haematopus]
MSAHVEQPEEIREFLASFKPSLAYLLPGFIEVGIVNHLWLLAISRWERDHLVGFFSNRYHNITKGDAPLSAVVVEALVVRLSDNRCVCGLCEDLLPRRRSCSALHEIEALSLTDPTP